MGGNTVRRVVVMQGGRWDDKVGSSVMGGHGVARWMGGTPNALCLWVVTL